MNKRTIWGSLWLPDQETRKVCHILLQDPKFFVLLLQIDEALASESRSAGCSCGGILHRANYPRKPRACPESVRMDFESRFSFCCNQCRKRTTSVSVRFLGRRVYPGLAVVLMSAGRAHTTSIIAQLSETLNIPMRTIYRWRQWWRELFPITPLWQAACARFMPPVDLRLLPASLIGRFVGPAIEAMQRLLIFLSPLTVKFRSL